MKFLKHLFNKIAPRKQRKTDNFYIVKVTLYYFFLWYVLAWGLFYLIYKSF